MSRSEPWVTLEGAEGPGRGRHIVFISGDEEYRSEEALPMLAQVMAIHHGFRCTVLFAVDPDTGFVTPAEQTNIPGMHHLDAADMVVLSIRFRELPDEDMKHFIDYTFSGKPILALRTATHAFAYTRNPDSPFAKYGWNDKDYDGGFGRQVLGETWVSHHGHHGFESTRTVPRGDHPVLQGVGSIWGPTDVYEAHPPDDATVLLDGHVLTAMDPKDPEKPDTPTMPVAWIRQSNPETGTGRILCSTMGAAIDLKDASLRRLLVNGIYWCLGMESEISLSRSVDPPGSYNPSYFGFSRESTGKRPHEFFTV